MLQENYGNPADSFTQIMQLSTNLQAKHAKYNKKSAWAMDKTFTTIHIIAFSWQGLDYSYNRISTNTFKIQQGNVC